MKEALGPQSGDSFDAKSLGVLSSWVCYLLEYVALFAVYLRTETTVLVPLHNREKPLMHTHPHIAEYLEHMCGPGPAQGYDRPEPTLEVCACVCLYVLACACESAVQNGVHK